MRKINLNFERDYENLKKSDQSTRLAQNKFYWAASLPSQKHELTVMQELKGKVVLEIGCSDGTAAERYSASFKKYVGIDISDVGIELAKSRRLKNADFICTDAHKLPFENQAFDVVVVTALLHHLDIPTALEEIHRVLRVGGVFLFLEPLGINPIFNLYRAQTPEARTVDERALSLRDINLIRQRFEIEKSMYFGLFSLVSAFVRIESVRKALTSFDGLVLRGPLKFFAWQFCGVGRKVI